MTKNKTIIRFLEATTTQKDFDLLPEIIGISETKWIRLQNGNPDLTYEEIRNLILFLVSKKIYPENISIEEFLTDYSIGKEITLTEIKVLNLLFVGIT